MIKKLLPIAIILLSALTASAETQTLKVDRFQKIRVIGPLNVDCVYNPDSVGYIAVDSPNPGRISWVEASTSGNKLKLQLRLPDDMRQGVIPVEPDLPRVKVYTNYLTDVSNEGDSIVRVITSTNVPSFTARLIGNGYLSVRGIDTEKLNVELITGRGTVAVHGTADEENIRLAGVGTIEADGVEAREAKVKTTGSGNIGVFATKTLKIYGAGSGTIFVKGSPEISRKMAIGVKLQPIE
ncbi:MAG: DUF2807 domain-containing protein [Muribaculaceae bacterium]|nr:DUF2807 domain-containing protein [Muribaculaceae bacterium]